MTGQIQSPGTSTMSGRVFQISGLFDDEVDMGLEVSQS